MKDIETLIELWDMPNGSDELSRDARDELTALRAAAAERDELRATVQAQAEQLEQAREVILKYRSLKLGPRGFCSENLFEHHNLADEWLAANAPQDVKA